MEDNIVIYQNKSGALELKGDFEHDTLWANLQQIANLFELDKSGISRHIDNIYQTGELNKSSTVAVFATVQKEGGRRIVRKMRYYNLDMILSVGYRVNSKKATKFRQWATKTLRQHITEGYTFNKNQLAKNYQLFLKAVEDVKATLPSSGQVRTEDALELVKLFASTWFSLDAYDKTVLPKGGTTSASIIVTSEELNKALKKLKGELLTRNEATELFGRETYPESLRGIIGNIFQSFNGKEIYPTLEAKAAHFLYLIVKNHPFVDGNKRSGAFAFIWFLRKANILNTAKLTPEALTALTLFVAESSPSDKEKIINLIMMIIT
jgi:prophage maintenance system killer protein